MLKLIAEGRDAVVPLDTDSVVPLEPDWVEFDGISERGSPVEGDITPPVPAPVNPLPEIVAFQMPVSESELLDPAPTGVIIPSDAHPVLEAPLTVVT